MLPLAFLLTRLCVSKLTVPTAACQPLQQGHQAHYLQPLLKTVMPKVTATLGNISQGEAAADAE